MISFLLGYLLMASTALLTFALGWIAGSLRERARNG
jgi:hypothetical protein